MRRAALLFARTLVLALAACGQTRDEPPAPRVTTEGFLGAVTYRYDPALLTAADVRVSFPAALGQDLYAVKLVPARGISGSPDLCPGAADGCPVELQPGVTLALLERPFDRYADAVQASELAPESAPTIVAGVEGIAIDAGTEGGLEVEYQIVPVDNRALLIMRQRDDQSPAEKQALDDVVASLDLGG
jgi:hypothetical protein